ncbi:ribosome-binding ATPase YchF [Algimonas ampicilliniresistens]|jgi:GTP-binding protein YchF|uniref:Ribosome-binding ATPase YchF n=1 Tax=Algimonas ampicilliniresistens TaxID=1298735 RepID=A0ABQ5V8W7_9PROT|nr:redox-regulated ATPase YchF [Algimonas ampicilliniresistens]GLQ23487.1 ribosome-binding ATPase YchF [Algimonas ampicilliniresistens]
MGFKCGIVGLPNVGKSTLFNALTKTANAQAANYPFCTIEPNVGDVAVPEARLDVIAEIGGSATRIPARMNFVDIAGLVKGASKGEGMGNQFLANIRETDAIIYVLRCFEDEDVTHVDGRIDPMSDFETIETELMLADLESLEKRKPGLEKKLKQNDKEAIQTMRLIETAIAVLEEGKPARTAEIEDDDQKAWRMLQLLTSKPVLYVANVDEDSAASGNVFSEKVMAHAQSEGAQAVVISAQIESEMAVLDDEEQAEYLDAIGLTEPGLNRLIQAGYALLGLKTYFTVGPKEARAWTFQEGWTAPRCAGVIHGDFEKGFIKAETTAFDDYVENNGEQGAKDAGKVRQEGKTYIVKDGDIMLFKFNV